MLSYTYMKSKRPELKEYYGENVNIKGVVSKISAQRGLHFDKKTVLLKNVVIDTPNSTLKYDHMWFTIPKYLNTYVNKIVQGTGIVTCYQRRDTSYDYTIRLNYPLFA